jgi:hypothetical protein
MDIKPYRVTWLFMATDEMRLGLQKKGLDITPIKPVGYKSIDIKDFDSLEEAQSFKSLLISIMADLRQSDNFFIDTSPRISDFNRGLVD